MFRSSILVTLLTLSASGLGFLVQLLLANEFGIAVDVDAYLYSLSMPTFLAGMLSAMFSYVVIPRLVTCETDQAYQRRYISSLLLSVAVLALALAVIGWVVVVPLQIHMLPAEAPLRNYSELEFLLQLGWVLGAVQTLAGVVNAVLNALRRYLIAAALALLPYVGMLVFMLGWATQSIARLPLGMLAGTVAAMLVGLYLLRTKIRLNPRLFFLVSEMRELVTSSPFAVIAMSCFSSYAVVDAYWAPRAGEGTLATLGYAQRLVIAIGNLVVAGPSAVLVPKLAEFIRDCDYRGFSKFLQKIQLWVGGGAVVLAVVIIIFASDIVEQLFARGAFGSQNVASVAGTLVCMAPGMIAMLVSVISMRALFCFKDAVRIAAFLGIGWSVIYFCASYLFISNGSFGLALAYTISWCIFLIVISVIIYSRASKC